MRHRIRKNGAPENSIFLVVQINGKSLFYVKAPETLDCKVACIGEVDKHANVHPKMLIFGGGLALRKPILHQINGKSLWHVWKVHAHLGTRFDISRNFI